MSARGAGGSGVAPSLLPPTGPDPDPLAGATIVVHDLSQPERPAASTTPAVSGRTEIPIAPAASGLSRSWKVLRQVVGPVLALLCLTLFGYRIWLGREPSPITIGALGSPARVEIRVHVDGAVAQPGVYKLAQGDRVEDAIKAAGGLTESADNAKLNLAQRVRDEQRLDVPFLPAARGGAAGAASSPAGAGAAAPTQLPPTANANTASLPAATTAPRPTSTPRPSPTQRPEPTPRATAFSGGKVNVNTATQAQLEQLPGFGPTSAQRILSYRAANGPLRSVEDLRRAGVQEQFIRQAADFLLFE